MDFFYLLPVEIYLITFTTFALFSVMLNVAQHLIIESRKSEYFLKQFETCDINAPEKHIQRPEKKQSNAIYTGTAPYLL